MRVLIFLFLGIFSFSKCDSHNGKIDYGKSINVGQPKPEKEIPVLCYHNIKNVLDHHSPELTVTEKTFTSQMEMLFESGYHTILPDQLYDYLTRGSSLPSKPIMLSFDDSHEEHYSIAAKQMEKYGFRGVFFVMTVAIDKPNYLSHDEIKALSDEGHVVACHTYDHPLVTKLQGEEWTKQIDESKKLLEQITRKPVYYFAYPYGQWNERAIEELKRRGIKAAFQLSEKQSLQDPLFTLRRIMVSDTWSTAKLDEEIHKAFDQKILANLKRK